METTGRAGGLAVGQRGVPPTVAGVDGTSNREPVSVEIYDQIYNLRGTDAGYIEQLAALVDGKMRAVAAHGGTVDSLRVAVLAALNISDELLTLRERYETLAGSLHRTQDSIRSRADTLAEMLDEVLEDRRAG